jgi:hypothetical protein
MWATVSGCDRQQLSIVETGHGRQRADRGVVHQFGVLVGEDLFNALDGEAAVAFEHADECLDSSGHRATL